MQGWRSSMEDADIIVTDYANDSDSALFGVFDGHGGSEVSRFCEKYYSKVLSSMPQFQSGDYKAALEESFLFLDQRMRDQKGIKELERLLVDEQHEVPQEMPQETAESDSSEDGGMRASSSAGSTAIVCLLKNGRLYVANAGDSRCVLCSYPGQEKPLSDDHKPNNPLEIERIKKAGGIVMNGRVGGSLNLSRALGDFEFKQTRDLPPKEQMVSPFPDVMVVDLDDEKDEFLILACDGIFEKLTWQSLVLSVRALLSKGFSLRETVEQTLDDCLAPASGQPGSDNMSIQLIICPTTAGRKLLEVGAEYKASQAAKPLSEETPIVPPEFVSAEFGVVEAEFHREPPIPSTSPSAPSEDALETPVPPPSPEETPSTPVLPSSPDTPSTPELSD